MAAEGAAIVDVGGESTRPGAKPVWEGDEIERTIPVIRQLAAGGGMPGMPGMPGGGSGPGKRGRQQVPQRKKSKSGNPAKRAAEERAAAARPASPAGGSFGVDAPAPGRGEPAAIDPSQLPKGFDKFLGQ